MSIFSRIKDAIFGSNAAARPSTPSPQATPGRPPSVSTGSAAPSTKPAQAPAQPVVDVEAVLEKMAATTGQKLNWRTSIVDLMKLLKLDSGLAARKTLAKELNYTGDTNDSAKMNVWLHKQVMAKLAQNGGKLPDDLKPDRLH